MCAGMGPPCALRRESRQEVRGFSVPPPPGTRSLSSSRLWATASVQTKWFSFAFELRCTASDHKFANCRFASSGHARRQAVVAAVVAVALGVTGCGWGGAGMLARLHA